MTETLNYNPTDPNAPEFSEDEQNSLEVAEKLGQEESELYAGKYENAEELEQAYLELQKKLGSNDEDSETDTLDNDEVEDEEWSEGASLIADASNEFYTNEGQLSSETMEKFSEMSSQDLVEAFMEIQRNNPDVGNAPSADLTDAEMNQVYNSVGGEAEYQRLTAWAAENVSEDKLNAFNTVVDKGIKNNDTAGLEKDWLGGGRYENPEIALIYNILKSCCQDVQNEGRHFNKEYHVEVAPDGNKNIVIPNNYLRYDLNQNQVFKDKDLVRRNGKLYDLVNHTDEFDDSLYLDIVYFISFEDLPPVFRRYIISKASVKAATQLVNNSELVKLLQTEEATNRAACVEYDTDQGDYSFMGWPENTSYRAYQPYKVLQR